MSLQNCSSDKSSNEGTGPENVYPQVQSKAQPEIFNEPGSAGTTTTSTIKNDTNGRTSNSNITPTDTTVASDIYLRPDAATTQTQPPLNAAIDPRLFAPSGRFKAGGGRIDMTAATKRIGVPHDGRLHVHPACSYAFPAPGHTSTAGLTIDGSLNEWPVGSVIGVDRSGDAPGGNSNFDLIETYWARDSNYIYIGAKVAGTWPTARTSNERLILEFRSLTMPNSDAVNPSVAASSERTFEIFGPELWEYTGSYAQVPRGTGAGQVDYTLTTSGQNIEIKIARNAVESLMNSKPYVVDIKTYIAGGSPAFDRVGPHVIGLQDDYACLLPMPDPNGDLTSFKMFVFRRDSRVAANVAEVIYRAMIAAAPTAEYVLKDHDRYFDTQNITASQYMQAAGIYSSASGIFIKRDINNVMGEYGLPIDVFFVAAHEYLHGFNTMNYQLPNSWMAEGHSDWIATRALESYYGPNVSFHHYSSTVHSFLTDESINGVTTIADSNWGNSPYSAIFYYYKAAAFYTLMAEMLDYSDFLGGVLQKSLASSPLADTNAFISTLKSQSSYRGSPGDDLTSGWFGGNYDSSIFPRQHLSDSDADGLFDHQEAALGTNPASADSDGDGLSDSFEISHGLDPLTPQSFNFLAADNLLRDWEILAPSLLRTHSGATSLTAPCGSHSDISRYGAVFMDNWLLIALETAAQPSSADMTVVVWIKEPSNVNPQFQASWGNSHFHALTNDGTAMRPGMLSAPFTGKTIEFAYNAKWLNWSTMQSGTTVRIAVYMNNTLCDITNHFAPGTNL